MQLELVISGGQTGADQAGWRAAKAAGIATSGWMPKGFKTEDGNHPEFAELYGAREHASRECPPRTAANVDWADVTLWFGDRRSWGGRATSKACLRSKRNFWPIDDHGMRTFDVADAILWENNGIKIVNIAGNRESTAPGIGETTERYLTEVFRLVMKAGRP